MEDLGSILRRVAAGKNMNGGARPPAAEEVAEEPTCAHCKGRGWLSLSGPTVLVGHPDFGKVVPCACRQAERAKEAHERLVKYSNLGPLTRFTFDTVAPGLHSNLTGSLESYERAYAVAQAFSEEPEGWLVILGPHGSGKTVLAAAVANRCIDQGQPVFFSFVPELLDHLRSTFSPSSEVGYSELFEQVKVTPVLVLDGLGSHSTTPWAEEKLGQVINHRHNAVLPTIVTSVAPLHELDLFVSTRLQAGLSRVVEIEPKGERPASGSLGRIEPDMLARMSFETYDVNRRGLSAREQTSVQDAFTAASSFGESPDGWLVLSGNTGVGKTHLAVAVAAKQLERGQAVVFAFVPDLMDYLRDTFGPQSTVRYEHVFEDVKAAPLLVLDDFGKERPSEWVVEKLYQIIVHRHNARLPTVITTMREFAADRDPIISRILDPSLSTHVRVAAPDYRTDYRPRP